MRFTDYDPQSDDYAVCIERAAELEERDVAWMSEPVYMLVRTMMLHQLVETFDGERALAERMGCEGVSRKILATAPKHAVSHIVQVLANHDQDRVARFCDEIKRHAVECAGMRRLVTLLPADKRDEVLRGLRDGMDQQIRKKGYGK